MASDRAVQPVSSAYKHANDRAIGRRPMHDLAAYPVPQSMTSIRDYVALLKHSRAHVPVPLQQRIVPMGGLGLQSSDDGQSLQAQTPDVAPPDYAAIQTKHKSVTYDVCLCCFIGFLMALVIRGTNPILTGVWAQSSLISIRTGIPVDYNPQSVGLSTVGLRPAMSAPSPVPRPLSFLCLGGKPPCPPPPPRV